MSNRLDIDDLIAQHGWEPDGDLDAPERDVREGDATRRDVVTESGTRSLLYCWEDERMAARASYADGIPATSVLPGGDPLRLTEVEPGRSRELASGLGMVVRKLHAVPVERKVGDLLEPDPAYDEPTHWLTFSGYVAHQLEWFAEHLRQQEFADAKVTKLAASIGDLRHELSAFHPRNPVCVCHGQLSFEHVWLDESGREVIALTGFERAAVLPREADLAYLLWLEGLGRDRHLARAFYHGYGAARTMDVQRRERFYRRLVAFQALFDAKGDVRVSTEELMNLASPRAIT